jgi:hypothetical protein
LLPAPRWNAGNKWWHFSPAQTTGELDELDELDGMQRTPLTCCCSFGV